jgi:hypothetical protein
MRSSSSEENSSSGTESEGDDSETESEEEAAAAEVRDRERGREPPPPPLFSLGVPCRLAVLGSRSPSRISFLTCSIYCEFVGDFSRRDPLPKRVRKRGGGLERNFCLLFRTVSRANSNRSRLLILYIPFFVS